MNRNFSHLCFKHSTLYTYDISNIHFLKGFIFFIS